MFPTLRFARMGTSPFVVLTEPRETQTGRLERIPQQFIVVVLLSPNLPISPWPFPAINNANRVPGVGGNDIISDGSYYPFFINTLEGCFFENRLIFRRRNPGFLFGKTSVFATPGNIKEQTMFR